MANDFLTTYAPLANDIATRTGLDPSVVLGIIDTETGGGAHVKGNNIFGISPSGPQGQYVATYPDVQTAANAFITLMQTPRYAGVARVADPASQSAALVRSGYNTANPQYASIVTNKALNFGKQLGYQDAQPGPSINATTSQPARDYSGQPTAPATQPPASAPDYNTPAPAAAPAQPAPAPAPAPSGSAKDDLKQELGGGVPQQPATPAPATPPKSAKDELKEELSQPSAPGALTGPPEKKPSTPAAPPEVDEYGNVIATHPAYAAPTPERTAAVRNALITSKELPTSPMAPAPGAVDRIIEAGREGAAAAPDASAWAPGGLQLGRYIVNPLLAGAGAVFRGGQQFVSEAVEPIGRDLPVIGHPGLGRDVAAMPEAFPMGAGELGGLRLPAPQSYAEARAGATRGPFQTRFNPSTPQPVTLEELNAAMRRADEAGAAGEVPLAPSGRPPSTEGPGPADRNASTAKPAQSEAEAAAQAARDAADRGAAQGADGPSTHIWRSKDYDFPVTPTGVEHIDKKSGRVGVEVRQPDGSISIVPKDELHAAPPAGGAQAQAAGADVTRGPIPEKTREQKATDIRSDVRQTARDRAGGDALRDDETYFENPPGREPFPERPEALRDFSPQTALDHEYYYSKDPEYRERYDQNRAAAHRDMTDWLREEIGDDNTVRQLKDFRQEVTPEKMKVFAGESPVDPAMLEAYRKQFEEVVNSLDKRDLVRPILEKAYAKLFDKSGNLETLPSRLQKVRDNMTDQLALKHGSTDLSSAVRAVQRELTDLVEGLNPVMTSGAPKWDTWRAAWAERSRAIDRQQFLQNYDVGKSKSLWDKNGKIQPHKVEKLLSDIANAHRDFSVHDAHSITEAQIRQIVAIRNEVATEAFLQSQAKLAHSPTARLMERAAKEGGTTLGAMARTAVDMGLHGAAAYAAQRGVGGLNFALGMIQATRPAREAKKVARRAATLEEQSNALKERLLSTPSSRAPNALTPP